MTQTTEPTVYVIDDDEAVRDSLRALFQSVNVQVKTFTSAIEFLESADEPRVGCLLVDIRMPGLSGLELQAQLAERMPHLPVILITGHGDVPSAVRAMKAGAKDFIEKPFNEQALLERVQICLSESNSTQQEINELRHVQARINQLTRREREVLALMVRGKSSKIIARELNISPKTVDVHRSRLMEKVGAKSLAELIRLVIELERHPEQEIRAGHSASQD